MTAEFLFMNLICPIQTKPISQQSIVSLTIKKFHIDSSQSKTMRITFFDDKHYSRGGDKDNARK